MARRMRALATLVLSLIVATMAPVPGSASAATTSPTSTNLCSQSPSPGHVTCFAEKYTGVLPYSSTPYGFGPSDLQSAYALPSSTGGVGQTVYIVDAYDDPTAEADLAAYRAQYGLAACTTANGCFAKLNQSGAASPLPAFNAQWAGEIALDLDMVSAVCPNCNIRLLEASSSGSDMYTAVQTAVSRGAHYVSLSWGGAEFSSESYYDTAAFGASDVLFAASTGDSGFAGGVSYPAASPKVLAVGGTSLTRDGSARGWSETAWSGAGSGCSAYEPKPTWQSFIPSSTCANRALADVSAIANPSTGVAVYNAGGWGLYGGTSAAAPVVAGIAALTGAAPSGSSVPQLPYTNTDKLTDVLSGSSGTCAVTSLCTAATGWDGPTGLGTPIGIAAFSGTGSSTPIITELGGNLQVGTAIAGLPASAVVTPIVPSGHTLAGVAWKAARSDCAFADPSALSTTVSCNASSAAATTVTATLTDSAGLTKAVTGRLAFTPTTSKRAVTFAMAIDAQRTSASVCSGSPVPQVGTVIDSATGQPVKGVKVTFTRKAATATTASSAGSAVSGVDGAAVGTTSATAAMTYTASSTAAGVFNAGASATEAVTITSGMCAPSLTASMDTASAWYGDTVHVSGTLVRPNPSGSGTIAMGSVKVPITLTVPATKVGGTPTVTTVATATTRPNGTFTATFAATRSGQVRAAVKATTSVSAASADLGALAVSIASTTLTGSAATTSIGYGQTVSVSGSLSRVRSTTQPLSAYVALSIVKTGATASTSLGQVRSAANGTFVAAVKPTVTGELWAKYAGVAGTTGSTVDLGPITVNSWTPALTLTTSATSVVAGGKITVSGIVTRSLDSASGFAGVKVRIVLTPTAGGTPIVLGSVTSNATTGAYKLAPVIKVAGTVTAQVKGVAGYDDASSPGTRIALS